MAGELAAGVGEPGRPARRGACKSRLAMMMLPSRARTITSSALHRPVLAHHLCTSAPLHLYTPKLSTTHTLITFINLHQTSRLFTPSVCWCLALHCILPQPDLPAPSHLLPAINSSSPASPLQPHPCHLSSPSSTCSPLPLPPLPFSGNLQELKLSHEYHSES